jgi:hypothetical protein
MRAMAVAVSLMFVLIPNVVTGQTPLTTPARLSLQVAGGSTVLDAGNTLSAAFGYSPVFPLELLFNVERIHLPDQLKEFPSHSVFRPTATMTFVSGELRFALRPAHRVSPFLMAGVGRGDSEVMYLGGGVRVPLRPGFSLLADARAMLGFQGDGVLGTWPVRAGVVWRF